MEEHVSTCVMCLGEHLCMPVCVVYVFGKCVQIVSVRLSVYLCMLTSTRDPGMTTQ